MSGKLLTTTQAAAMLQVSRDTVARWARYDQIEAVRLPSGHWRIREEDVQALLRRERPMPP
jgi:excisionase family DNA binding protein